MSAAVDHLRTARFIIAEPTRFTIGWYARDAHGGRVWGFQPVAERFCAYGALQAAGAVDGDAAYDLLRTAAHALFQLSPSTVNDGLGHAAVLKMYDAAIAEAEAA